MSHRRRNFSKTRAGIFHHNNNDLNEWWQFSKISTQHNNVEHLERGRHDSSLRMLSAFEERFKDEKWFEFCERGEKQKIPKKKRKFEDKFQSIADDIYYIVKFVKRNGGSDATNNSKMHSYAKRLIYQLGTHCIEHKLEDELLDAVIKRLKAHNMRLRSNKRSINLKNPFYLCYRAVFLNEKIIKSGECSRSARQLLSAYNQYVPIKYLIGYIYQTSSTETVQTLKEQQRQKEIENARKKRRVNI